MCQEEADLEPKLVAAGSPPRSLGLGDTQLKTCLFSPPKLLFLLLLPRLFCGGCKLGFLARSPQKGDLPWPQHCIAANLEFNPAEAEWGSNMQSRFFVAPMVASLKKAPRCTHYLLDGSSATMLSSGERSFLCPEAPASKLEPQCCGQAQAGPRSSWETKGVLLAVFPKKYALGRCHSPEFRGHGLTRIVHEIQPANE